MFVFKDRLLSLMRHEEMFWKDETCVSIETSFNGKMLSLKTMFHDETCLSIETSFNGQSLSLKTDFGDG